MVGTLRMVREDFFEDVMFQQETEGVSQGFPSDSEIKNPPAMPKKLEMPQV